MRKQTASASAPRSWLPPDWTRPHELARRLDAAERTAVLWLREFVAAKRTADSWHDQYKRTERTLLRVYDSIWWRMTEPLRRLVDRVKRRSG